MAIVHALIENRVPTQSSLRSFEDEEFEECAVVVQRHTPLLIVVADRQLVIRPSTTYWSDALLHRHDEEDDTEMICPLRQTLTTEGTKGSQRKKLLQRLRFRLVDWRFLIEERH